jgi:hypothetical protein
VWKNFTKRSYAKQVPFDKNAQFSGKKRLMRAPSRIFHPKSWFQFKISYNVGDKSAVSNDFLRVAYKGQRRFARIASDQPGREALL